MTRFLSYVLFAIFFVGVYQAAPLTLAEQKNRDYRVQTKTSLDILYKSRGIYAHNLYDNYSIYGGADTQVTLAHNFVYAPSSNFNLILAGNGSYHASEHVGLNTYEEKEYIKLDSFWVGASFVGLFFDALNPVLNVRMGNMDNGTSYFMASSLRLLLTQRVRLDTSWENHYYQINPKGIGWNKDVGHYTLPSFSLAVSYAFNPHLEFSFLSIYRGAGGGNEKRERFLLNIKRIF